MAIFDQEHRPPEPDEFDTAHSVAKAALGALPIVGSTAQELLQRIITPPLMRRQQEWMEDVGDAICKLEAQKGIRPEQLRNDPAFIDAVLSATQAAITTSQKEKRQALLSAVLNSALSGAPELAEQHIFIALIDHFTEWHLRILHILANPESWFQYNRQDALPRIGRSGNFRPMLEQAYPELQTKRDLVDLVCAELNERSLIRVRDILASGTIVYADARVDDVLASRTTGLGNQFLRYIESPID